MARKARKPEVKKGLQKFRFLEVSFVSDEDGADITLYDSHSDVIAIVDAKNLKDAAREFRDIAHWLTLQ